MNTYKIHHTPSTCSAQMSKAFVAISEALTTQEQKEALAYLEREFNLALAYITELEWDTEEAAALIKQTYINPTWAKSLDYMEDWAQECYSRLDSHRQRQLSCLVKGTSLSAVSNVH